MKQPHGVGRVLPELIDPGEGSDLAMLIGELLDAAEGAPRLLSVALVLTVDTKAYNVGCLHHDEHSGIIARYAMTLRDLQLRAHALFRPHRVEQELNEELAFHLERETNKLIEAGMPPAAARLRAQARFGSTALAADQCPERARLSGHGGGVRSLESRSALGVM